MKRTDAHSPSNFDPREYEFFESYSTALIQVDIGEYEFLDEDGMQMLGEMKNDPEITFALVHGDIEKWAERCDHCGARFKHGAIYRHTPSGVYIVLGHTCAAKFYRYSSVDMSAYQGRIAAQVAKQERYRKARARVFELLAAWRKMDPAKRRELYLALKTDHNISRDLRAKLIQYGGLSLKQIAFALRLRDQVADRAAADAADDTVWIDVPQSDKRVKLAGTILSTKSQEDAYGTSFKMLVKIETAAGCFKVWGSIPEAMWTQLHTPLNAALDAEQDAIRAYLDARGVKYSASLSSPEDQAGYRAFVDALPTIPESKTLSDFRGMQVEFMCRLERSGRDAGFGFYKRPTKVVLA